MSKSDSTISAASWSARQKLPAAPVHSSTVASSNLRRSPLMRRKMPIFYGVSLALLTTFVFLRWTGLALATLTCFNFVTAFVLMRELGAPRRARRAKRDELMRAAKERFGLR